MKARISSCINQEQVILTSKMVLEDPERTVEELSSHGTLVYRLTTGELEWLEFIKGRYSIAVYLYARLDGDIITIDEEFSGALDEDCGGVGKAVMLGDDSALQAIFFYNYKEEVEDELG